MSIPIEYGDRSIQDKSAESEWMYECLISSFLWQFQEYYMYHSRFGAFNSVIKPQPLCHKIY